MTSAILFMQLDLQRRVDRSKLNYDPAAERILINALTQGRSEDRAR
jgi:hypothetical protein